MKKLSSGILCAILLFYILSTVAACVYDDSEKADPNRTQLYVGIYDGGYGTQWLYEAKRIFEERYPEVQIMISGDKRYSMNTLFNTIESNRQDMYFSGLRLYDFASQGKIADISDIMDKPLKDLVRGCDETATIKDKMWKDLDEYYSSYKNKYYAIPFGGSVYSINYDVDLFDEEKLYIGINTPAIDGSSNVNDIEWVGASGEKSLGQDNLPGTYDDGLPVTWEEFKLLMLKMKHNSITPFLWSSTEGYTNNFLYSLAMSFDGKDNFELNKTFSGSYTFEGDSQPTVIRPDNGYLLQGMKGKKVALEFAKEIIDGKFYHEDSGTLSMDFMTAQDEYLMSKVKTMLGQGDRIAFLIDGGHWHNEAKNTFELMVKQYGPEYANRKFGIMPFPKFEGQNAVKTTYYASSFNTAVYIYSGSNQIELAKTFLAFTTTDEILRLCTRESGMVRPFDYSLTEDDLSSMPYYYQTVWSTFNSDNVDIAHFLSSNPMVYENMSFFENEWTWACQSPSGKIYSYPFTDFRKADAPTVETYFSALKSYYSEIWNDKFGRYFNN